MVITEYKTANVIGCYVVRVIVIGCYRCYRLLYDNVVYEFFV